MVADNVRPFAPRGGSEPPEPPPVVFPATDASSLADKAIVPRRWHVEDMIPAGTVTILNGDGGTGKSLISLQLSVATVTGSLWIGRSVTRGKCLFLTAEDDMDELHRRLVDIAANLQVNIAEMDGLVIVSLAGEDALLAAPNGKSNIIKTTRIFETLEKHVAELQPALVVLDTLADLFGGEENQRAQARQFIGILRGLALHHDTTILLLAHPSLAGMSTGTGTSGSTAWSNSVRSRLYLERPKDDGEADDDPDARTLRGMKANYGKTGMEIKLRWRAGVFINDMGETFAEVAAVAKGERIFLELLRAYTKDQRWVSPSPGHSYAPSLFGDDTRRDGVTKAGFASAMNRLFEAGKICTGEYGPKSRRLKRVEEVAFFRSTTGED